MGNANIMDDPTPSQTETSQVNCPGSLCNLCSSECKISNACQHGQNHLCRAPCPTTVFGRGFGDCIGLEYDSDVKTNYYCYVRMSNLCEKNQKDSTARCFIALSNSPTGTRTRVTRVRAEYPNQLDYSGDDIICLLYTSPSPRD